MRFLRLVLLAIVLLAGLAPPALADEPGPDALHDRWIRRAGSVELSPRLSPFGSTRFNEDFVVGLTGDVWLTEWLGIEANVSLFPLGGPDHHNETGLSLAILRLLASDFRLEAVERHAAWTLSVALLPLWGHLAPPLAPPAGVDLLVALGAGVELDAIELLAHDGVVGIDEHADRTSAEPWVHPVLNLVVGSRLWLSRHLALRVEGRLLGGPVTVLDFSEDRAAATNRELGPTATRLTCDDDSVPDAAKACTTAWEGSFTVELGLDFGLGPRRGAPR